jgi:hypothetical protein
MTKRRLHEIPPRLVVDLVERPAFAHFARQADVATLAAECEDDSLLGPGRLNLRHGLPALDDGLDGRRQEA